MKSAGVRKEAGVTVGLTSRFAPAKKEKAAAAPGQCHG